MKALPARGRSAPRIAYRLSMKGLVSRSKGHSLAARAAYIWREKMRDERLQRTFDFTKHPNEALFKGIFLPANAPEWAKDINRLLAELDKAEKRKDAQLARSIELNLPYELTLEENEHLLRDFVRENFTRKGHAVIAAIHAPDADGDERNIHAHLLIILRTLDERGFSKSKAAEQDNYREKTAYAEGLRESWAKLGARYLEKAGYDLEAERWRHGDKEIPEQRAIALERGDLEFAEALDREAGKHLGQHAAALERKGIRTARGDLNREIDERNRARAGKRQAERGQRSALKTAIEQGDAEAVLEQLTRRQATFTGEELDHALYAWRDEEAAETLKAEILDRAEIIPLYDRESGQELDRYTVQAVRDVEQETLDHAAALAESRKHGISKGAAAAALATRQTMREEQRRAFDHATGNSGLAIIDGKAGTGKSYTLAAIRDAYEADGRRVIGLAPTNAVAEDMETDGFSEARTIHSALFRLENERDEWNKKTVVIVDEAAMIDTAIMRELVARAAEAEAKLILVGDDRQLASIERGGLFTELKARHGAAELVEVTRQRKASHRAMAGMLAKGEFGEAVTELDRMGAIRRHATPEESRAALVEQWTRDSEAAPDKRRFVFAYTNDSVRELNADIRAIRKERGELGEDHELETSDGRDDFAAGDRLIFTATDRKRGITNGAIGTIERIEGETVTLKMDGKGERRLEFDAGEFDSFRHGYAGTIHKGQGRTFDEVYLYHSSHWRDAASYVALTRHRDDVKLFVSDAVTRDNAALARQMARHEDRRASVAYATREEIREREIERERSEGWETRRARPPLTAKEALASPELQEQYTAQRVAEMQARARELTAGAGRERQQSDRTDGSLRPPPMRTAASFADGAAKAAEGLLGAIADFGAPPAPKLTVEEAAQNYELQEQYMRQRNAERQAQAREIEALRRMAKDRETGRTLDLKDLQSLETSTLEDIYSKGDRELIERIDRQLEADRQRQRHRSRGR